MTSDDKTWDEEAARLKTLFEAVAGILLSACVSTPEPWLPGKDVKSDLDVAASLTDILDVAKPLDKTWTLLTSRVPSRPLRMSTAFPTATGRTVATMAVVALAAFASRLRPLASKAYACRSVLQTAPAASAAAITVGAGAVTALKAWSVSKANAAH